MRYTIPAFVTLDAESPRQAAEMLTAEMHYMKAYYSAAQMSFRLAAVGPAEHLPVGGETLVQKRQRERLEAEDAAKHE